jgi:hypothetical protein
MVRSKTGKTCLGRKSALSRRAKLVGGRIGSRGNAQ